MLVVIVFAVVLVLAALVPRVRSWRRRAVEQQSWQWRAQETCSLAAAIHDRLDARLSAGGGGEEPGGQGQGEDEEAGQGEVEDEVADRGSALALAERRWDETERLMDQFSARLHSLFPEAPNLLVSRALSDLQVALMSLRSAFQIQQGLWMDRGSAAMPPAAARVRLADFDGATRVLRATI